MELIIILILILLNGIFAMSEMSLVASRKFKLENSKKKGNKGAKIALDLSENPTKFLSTVQIGITLIGIFLGAYSGDTLTKYISDFLVQLNFPQAYIGKVSSGLVVIFITYLSIVLGELFPKRVGMTFPEPIITLLAYPMQILSKLTSPFVWLLTASNNLLLKIFRIKGSNENAVSEEEIKSIIKESTESGEIQEIEHEIVERVFEMGDRKVTTLLTHKNDIVFFTINDTWEEIASKINKEKHSAYPVSKTNSLDDIVGIVSLKQLFTPRSWDNFKIENHITQPLYFNENTSAYKVLESFKSERIHYGIIIDEYGSVEGMVTMDDVVDALIGDVTENDQDEYKIEKIEDNYWIVDGQYNVIDFAKTFSIYLNDDQYQHINTVAGLFINRFNNIPNVGDSIIIEDCELVVLKKESQRIEQISVRRVSN